MSKESVADIAKRQASKGYTKFKDTDIHTRLKQRSYAKHAGIVGAALGLANVALDNDDDDLISTGLQVGALAGVSAGGSEILYRALNDQKLDRKLTAWGVAGQENKEQSNEMATRSEERSTISNADVNKEEVHAKAQNKMTEQAEVRKAQNFFSKAKVAGALGLGAVAVASVLDFSEELEQDVKVESMKAKQEENIIRRRKAEDEAMSQYGYGHVDMGQIAIDMFNDRIGHFKMGNAKFE